MSFFKCKHPIEYHHVEKNHTIEVIDEDFEKVRYYLYCVKCEHKFTVGYSRCIGGVDKFLERPKQ